MDYETYQQEYIVDPAPEPRFEVMTQGATLFYEDYAPAVAFYSDRRGMSKETGRSRGSWEAPGSRSCRARPAIQPTSRSRS